MGSQQENDMQDERSQVSFGSSSTLHTSGTLPDPVAEEKRRRMSLLHRRIGELDNNFSARAAECSQEHEAITAVAAAANPKLFTRRRLLSLNRFAQLKTVIKLCKHWTELAEGFEVIPEIDALGIPAPPSPEQEEQPMSLLGFRLLLGSSRFHLLPQELSFLLHRVAIQAATAQKEKADALEEEARLKAEVEAAAAAAAGHEPENEQQQGEGETTSQDSNAKEPPLAPSFAPWLPVEERAGRIRMLSSEDASEADHAEADLERRLDECGSANAEVTYGDVYWGVFQKHELAALMSHKQHDADEEAETAAKEKERMDKFSERMAQHRAEQIQAVEEALSSPFIENLTGSKPPLVCEPFQRAVAFSAIEKGNSLLGVKMVGKITNHHEALVACAKFGKGFQGMLPEDLVSILRSYAAERIQAQWRGFRRYKRFKPTFKALKILMNREAVNRQDLKVYTFRAWHTEIQRLIALFEGGRRSFLIWKRIARREKAKAEMFRGTYWALHVWRRYVNTKHSSKDKARFLKRVFHDYCQLRYFRAWSRYVDRVRRPLRIADQHAQMVLETPTRAMILWWHQRVQHKKAVYKAWMTQGLWLRIRITTRFMKNIFIAWRYWNYAKTACRQNSQRKFRSHYILAAMARRQLRGMMKATKETDANSISYEPILKVTGHPSMQALRTAGDKWFGWDESELSSSTSQLCAKAWNTYRQKEQLKACGNFMLYQRAAPGVLLLLERRVWERKKYRFAAYQSTRRIQTNAFRTWVRATRVEEQPLDGSETASQRLKHLSTRKSCNQQQEPAPTLKPLPDGAFNDEDLMESHAFLPSVSDNRGVLVGDRDIRQKQLEWSKRRVMLAKMRLQGHGSRSTGDSELNAHRFAFRKRREREIAKMLTQQGHGGNQADVDAQAFAASFRTFAANKLIETLMKITDEARTGDTHSVMTKVLHEWHFVTLERRSVHMCNRQRIRNWLRLCCRLRHLWRGMPLYHELKTKQRCFNSWCRGVEVRHKLGTCNLKELWVRRRKLLLAYNELLQQRGVRPVCYSPAMLNQVTSDDFAVMARWKRYTQERVLWRALEGLLERKQQLKLQARVFAAWRRGWSPSKLPDGVATLTRYLLPYRQVCVDIETLGTMVLTHKRLELCRKLITRHARESFQRRRAAREAPSFKKFMGWFRHQAQLRVSTEARILADNFLRRGMLTFQDHDGEIIGRDTGREIMHFKTKPVAGEFLLDQITVTSRKGEGVLALQISLRADTKTLAMPVCGADGSATHTKRHVFTINTPLEKLSGMELVYSTVIEKIRFLTSIGRWSPWYGERFSMNAKSMVIPKEPLEDPERYYITGIHGCVAGTRMISLGLVQRRVSECHIFSYLWSPEGPQAKKPKEEHTMSRKEQYRARIAAAKEAKSAAENANKGQSKDHKARHSAEKEFAHVLRMRRGDATRAVERATDLARRLWSSPAGEGKIMSRLPCVMGITTWLFEALLPHLVKVPVSPEKLEAAFCHAQEICFKAKQLQERGQHLAEQAMRLDKASQPTHRGPQSMQERETAMKNRKMATERQREAHDVKERGDALAAEGEALMLAARSQLPTVHLSDSSIRYYLNKLKLARRQLDLEEEFGRASLYT
ncbi:unnamed protein product [Chrysoparadoxa australica]